MLVLLVEPGKEPRRMEMDNDLQSMQKAVGGLLQVIYPFREPVALVCNDEGKLLGLPANRGLRDEQGQLYDIVCGTFFLCAAPLDRDSFESLTEEQLEHYRHRFQRPELFVNLGGEILCLPI